MTTTTTPPETADANQQAEPGPAPGRSLRSLTIRGSIWTIGGYGASFILRMGSNLILTRLLFPEAFGLMLLVNVFLQAVEMFSDLGIRVSIIQHPRGDDPAFLNTAWTIQVLRGFAMWICACLVAVPAAGFYGQPELAGMLPVAAFASVIIGFQSTSLSTLNRGMLVGRLTLLMLVSQVVSTGVMVLCAWYFRSPWALLTYCLVNNLVRTVLSHVALPGIRNHFQWDPEARKALFGFGKWVFLSTAFTFLADQSDRLWLGKFLDAGTLGVFGIAVTLCGAATVVLWEVCQWVLMPAFSRVHREDSTRLRDVYEQVRSRFDLVALPGIGLMIATGDVIVHMLWDERYADAGWMFQVLAVGVACFYTLPFAWCCQAARGDLRYWLWGNVGRTLWLWAGVPYVWHEWGALATIWFVALSQLPPLIVAWLRLRHFGILSLRRELLALSYLAGGGAAGWLIRHFLLAPALVA